MIRYIAIVISVALMLFAAWPRKPKELPMVLEVANETPTQRYFRTKDEWERLSDLARDEKTDLRKQADAAYIEFEKAKDALKQSDSPESTLTFPDFLGRYKETLPKDVLKGMKK